MVYFQSTCNKKQIFVITFSRRCYNSYCGLRFVYSYGPWNKFSSSFELLCFYLHRIHKTVSLLLYFLKTLLSCEAVKASFYCLLRVYSCLHLFSPGPREQGLGTKTILKQRLQFVYIRLYE